MKEEKRITRIKLFIIIIAILVVIGVIVAIIININKNDNTENEELKANTLETGANDKNTANEFVLYENAEEMVDVTVGTYIYNQGRKELCKMQVPSNYQIKNGLIRNVEEKENIEGTISSLQKEGKLLADDKLLCAFYLGNNGFNYVEPSENDTVIRVGVYTDSWKEMEKVNNAYEVKIGNITAYALRDDERNKDAVNIYIPFDEYLMVCIKYQTSPQIDSTSLEAIADAVCEKITILYNDSEYEEQDKKENSNTSKEEEISNITWSDLFQEGGNKVTLHMKSNKKKGIFKIDYPESYEIDTFQRDYEGQTVKNLVEKSGNVHENVWVRNKSNTSFTAMVETIQSYGNETWTQRMQRKNPEGFSMGTEEHPGYAYKSDSGTIYLSYQGGDHYALEISYYNSDVIRKYGVKAIAEYLYNMVSYIEN